MSTLIRATRRDDVCQCAFEQCSLQKALLFAKACMLHVEMMVVCVLQPPDPPAHTHQRQALCKHWFRSVSTWCADVE